MTDGIVKGGGYALEQKLGSKVWGSGCASWPCWQMEVGDLWIVPHGEEYARAQQGIHSHARNALRGAKKFKTRTIDGRLNVWRVA